MVFNEISSQLALSPWLLGVILVWSIIWKGLALWRSARLSQPIWFVVLLVFNTLGLLEILYIFFFSRINFLPRKEKSRTFPGKKKIDLDITHSVKRKQVKKKKRK